MATYLICSSPARGHVLPMATIGAGLASAGHRVRMLTGTHYEQVVRDAGLEFVALPPDCDFDGDDVEGSFPSLQGKKGLDRLRSSILELFIEPMPSQWRAVQEQLAVSADAVVVDFGFVGAVPLALQDRDARPPLVVCGILPVSLLSRDAPPFGLGLPYRAGRLGVVRNVVLNALVSKVVFGRVQRRASELAQQLVGRPLPVYVLGWGALGDRYLQFTTPVMEYPRRDLPPSFRFVGPLLPPLPHDFTPPPWWHELDGSRPVVHVTQGTVDNADLQRLVGPTLRALEHEDVLVVATTGGRSWPDDVPVPANARIAPFLPHGALLPLVDVMVSNGGYGGVHQALAHGIPLVLAGETEDKPDVARRVTRTGAGIDLRTGRPSPEQVRAAVRAALTDERYRTAARAVAEEFSRHDAMAAVREELEVLATERPSRVTR